MSDTAKQTTPDQDSQLDPIQWKYYIRMNKRNLSWKWLLQVRKIIYPWATKSRGRDFFKGGRFVTAWIFALFFFPLIFLDFLFCFAFTWLCGSETWEDHVFLGLYWLVTLIIIPRSCHFHSWPNPKFFCWEYSFSDKGITLKTLGSEATYIFVTPKIPR